MYLKRITHKIGTGYKWFDWIEPGEEKTLFWCKQMSVVPRTFTLNFSLIRGAAKILHLMSSIRRQPLQMSADVIQYLLTTVREGS